ncbi:MAG: hypothetical protein KC419_22870 [Anaerolineales bacterium]|nr:hypothetical protein [Anaerolineales bacterium]
MRSSALVGIVLTLLMLLLVALAAFIFLFQGRQTLETQNMVLRDDLKTAVSDNNAITQNRNELSAALATAESDAVLLEGQLVESEQAAEVLRTEVTDTGNALAQLEQDRLDMLARPPQVDIAMPEENSMQLAGTPFTIVVVAADPVGITEMTITLDDRLFRSYVVDGQPLLTATETWAPVEAGTFLLAVEASNGRTSSVITRTLAVTAPANSLSTVATDPNGALRADIAANVSELRGLRPLQAENSTILTMDEVQERIDNQMVWQTAVLPAVLTSFDFSSSEDAIVGKLPFSGLPATSFYDTAANEMLIAGDVGSWTPSSQLAYVHQYTHLLQDQHFMLDALSGETLTYDEQLALTALAAGDVGLVQNLYLRSGYFSDDAVNMILTALNDADMPDTLPIFAAEQQFREEMGLNFLQHFYDEDGFAAVNAIWQNLPRSTEQFLHPDKYAAGEQPDEITLPLLTDTLGGGWSLLAEDTFGELWLRTYLSQQLNQEQVETAASGWGGGRYVVYGHDTEDTPAMALWLTWDTPEDSVEFAALYPNYPTRLLNTVGQLQPDGSECWQGDDVICLYQRDDVTFIVRAPDLETAVSMANTLESN